MRIRSPKDFWAGLFFIAAALGFMLLSQQYSMGNMHRMGPALFAPKGTPQPIIDKLNAEVVKILNMPDVKERFAGGGVDTIPSSAAELDARVKNDLARFRTIVEQANIRPD